MASFTASVPLNIRWHGLEFSGPAGETFSLPDEYAGEFAEISTRVGGFQWRGTVTPEMFGARGDGTSDDTAALQLSFAALSTASGISFAATTYLISDTLDIPFVQYRKLSGAGIGATVLRQTTSNVPILRVVNENTHSIVVEGITFAFSTNQDSTKTSAVGISFAPTSGIANGAYYWTFRRIALQGCAYGIGTFGAGASVLWGSLLDDVRFSDISITALHLDSPDAVGMPVIVGRNIVVSNTGSGVIPSNVAIRLSAVGASFDGLDVEGWRNSIVYVDGAHPVAFRNIHVEHHSQTIGTWMFYVADGPVMLDAVQITADISAPSGTASVVKVDGSGFAAIRGIYVSATTTGAASAPVLLNSTSSGGGFDVSGVFVTNVVDPPTDTQTLQRIHSRDSTFYRGPTVYTKAGAIGDSDFTAPADGLIGIDTANSRLYARIGSAWKTAALA